MIKSYGCNFRRAPLLLAVIMAAAPGLSGCSGKGFNEKQALAETARGLQESVAPCTLKEPLTKMDFEPAPPDGTETSAEQGSGFWEGKAQITLTCPQGVRKVAVRA